MARMEPSLVFFSIILTSAVAGNSPSIRDNVGLTRPYHVYEGDDALITCVVQNAGDNTVTWKKENRERHSRRVLTAGQNRVTADKRISVLHDSVDFDDDQVSGGDVWVLVIRNANSSDSGIYICEVNSEPVARSFHKLSVLSRALQPPESTSVSYIFDSDLPKFDASSHNYTDCCVANNVTRNCLGFCNIQSILEGDTGQDPENCENDFPAIVKCMADGRNHVPCCIQEGVPDICQDVCRGEYTMITDNIKTHFSCSAYTEQTLACIVEGIELLPSMPENVEVEAMTDNYLRVNWSRPISNAGSITEYIVNVTRLRTFDEEEEDSYASALERNRKDEEKLTSPKPPSPKLEQRQIKVPHGLQTANITGLTPFTMYEITVTAKNNHGTSLPSYAIRALTLPQGRVKAKVAKAPKLPDVQRCCVEKGVKHRVCLDKLCDPVQSDIPEVPDLMICAPWVTSTFRCLTNGVDFSSCCKARGLPESCQVLCTGNVTQIDFSYFKCIKYMSDFSSCLFQSYGVLSSEPLGLWVSNVDSDFGIIHWNPPRSLGDTVLHYNLHYRLLATYDNDYKVITKVQSPYVLEHLQSDAEYEVYVEAVNPHGISDPSTRLIFRTKSRIIEEKIEEESVYNVTACCVNTGLSEICLPLCTYDASMVDIKNLAAICAPDFHKLIRCGAGGRNHGSCCTRRGVPSMCTSLCSGFMTESIFVTAAACTPYIGNIIQCFEEGTGLLPGPIGELHATTVTNTTIDLEWEPPSEGNATDYIVFYEKVTNSSTKDSFKLQNQLNTTDTKATLTALETDQLYKIFVVTRNQHGTSLPSSVLMINATAGTGERIKGVPSAPHSLSVSSHSANWVTITWQPPQYSQYNQAITYKLYHKGASENDYHVIETSVTSHMLDGLTPNTQYIVYVIAVSKSGQSLPSETLVAWTDPAYPAFVEPPTVHPINLVIEGSSMTILCIAMGTPTPTISLYISGRLVRQETTRHMVTVIHNVTRDMDQISCYADNGYGTPMQTTRKITISHPPHITASGITIAVHGDTVTLECQVYAHPEPKMMFWRNYSGREPVIQDARHTIRITNSTNEESKWTMGLIIRDITDTDGGDYFCHAENAFGSVTQPVSVRLRNVAASGNVTQCCIEQNVSSSCMDACTFFLDLDAVIDKPECSPDLDKLMKCAADGSDHRSCCTHREVPRQCLDWCRGEPLLHIKYCGRSFTRQIMSCFQEGRDKLPGPPQNVHMEPIDAHSVYIKWDAPLKNPHTVFMYRVFWRQLGSKTPMKIDTKDTRLKLTGLKEGVTYECMVKAGNHIGTSMLTEPFKFTTRDKYITSASSIAETDANSVGVVVGIVLAVFIVAAIVVGAVWFLRVRKMLGRKSEGGVAFENPSYLREANPDRSQGQVQISDSLQSSHLNGITNTVAPEMNAVMPQQGWKQETLHVPTSTEVPPSLYEELKLGQDGVGFKRLKP